METFVLKLVVQMVPSFLCFIARFLTHLDWLAKYTAADAAFTYLTGHQITEACSRAADGGYCKLATLISQAGGDELFKEDIRSQLEIWKNEKLAPSSNSIISGTQSGLVARGVWRAYSLLAGLIVEDDEKSRSEDDICAGLDWKRVFGLCLWYGTSLDATIADVVKAYEGMILRSSRSPAKEVARPIPKWTTEKRRGPQPPPLGSSRLGLYASSGFGISDNFPEDPLYALIKLHANPALSLSKALNPLSFSSAGVHLGVLMCWHLYIILSRVMQVRDFADRVLQSQPRTHRRRHSDFVNGIEEEGQDSTSDNQSILEEDGLRTDGHSPTADLLTSTYSFQLESWGMLQEAAFVLLHIEGSVGCVSDLCVSALVFISLGDVLL
jgi:nuclear pore complex protein Nup98-Nup96